MTTSRSSDPLARTHSAPGAGSAEDRAGFTRTDAVAVVAILALLGCILAPVRASHATMSHAAMCRSNLGRLATAWTQFANDNRGRIPSNPNAIGDSGWITGSLDYSTSSANTNTLYLLDPRYAQLGAYTGDARVYKCPSDRSQVPVGPLVNGVRLPIPRMRSYSANSAMGGNSSFIGDRYRVFGRLQDIVDPRPAKAFVFIDEHPDSINDGFFALVMDSAGNSNPWPDYPASHHDRGGALSFADGHAEVHPWVDTRTIVPVHFNNFFRATFAHNNPDVLWLKARTSSLR